MGRQPRFQTPLEAMNHENSHLITASGLMMEAKKRVMDTMALIPPIQMAKNLLTRCESIIIIYAIIHTMYMYIHNENLQRKHVIVNMYFFL